MDSAAELSRRQLLKLGATVAGATIVGTGGPTRVPAANAASTPPNVDHAAAARRAYRESLARLRRRVPAHDGTEVWESGLGTLAEPPVAIRAYRNARPGQADFDVLVIGSGYGGAVCAARLAQRRLPGVRIGLLERGREWAPGTFPDVVANLNPFSGRASFLGQRLANNPLGLYGFHEGDVEVVVGSGLGGTSLTNCAVTLETEDDVFRQAAWPPALQSKDVLRSYYELASGMLDPQTTPEVRLTPKLKTHLGSAGNRNAQGLWQAVAYRAPVAISFSSRANAQGMWQNGCVQCGDCATGCNAGAKNSLDMNYLPLAWAHGVKMFPQVAVQSIQKAGDHFRVEYLLRNDSGLLGTHETGVVTARVVVLGAGTMGTNEILLRSQKNGGIRVSKWLGKGFSANGNYMGFVDYQSTDIAVYTNTAGVGVKRGTPRNPVGAHIEGIIDFRRRDRPLERRVVIEDMAHASSLANSVSLLMAADLNQAMTLLGCGHDRATGEIRLDRDTVAVHWPDYGRQPSHAEMVRVMTEYARAYGGRFSPFKLAKNYTAHPLGGCRMGESAASGVVTHRGQVFDTSTGDESRTVYPDLYVADASIIPTALGNNPLLTITALAERIAHLIVNDPNHSSLFRPG